MSVVLGSPAHRLSDGALRVGVSLGAIVSQLLLLSACDGGAGDAGVGGSGDDGGGGSAPVVERGPAIVEIEGDPNGLWWDESTQALLVADDDGNRILQWTDADGLSLVTELPAASPEGAGLGQVVVTQDRTIVVPRFGYGTAGDVVYVPASGEAAIVPGLATERRRIGLTIAPDGTLFDSWFVRMESGDRVGAVGELSLSGAEPEILTGLQKPVGVLVLGDDLFVSDQDLGQILKAPLSDPTTFMVLAAVPSPDLLAAGPDGSLFTGSEGGNVFQIDPQGSTSVFEGGFDTVRGIAYDSTNRRLFVANHVGHEEDGVVHTIHILPVD